MQYLNPFLLLEIALTDGAEAASADQLYREKKRWLAEFELADETEIEVNGQRLDRSTLLRLFEELEDPLVRAHHRKIAAQPSLWRFLTSGSLDLFDQGDISLLASHSQDFLRFIAPYFAARYNQRLIYALKQHDAEEIRVLSSHPLVIPPTFHAACYQDTYRYLHATVEDIEQWARAIQKGESPDGRIQEYCDELLIEALNALPDYFAGVRDRYALALETLAIEVHNVHKRVRLGIYILMQGLKLQTSEETQRRLQHILEQLQAMAPMDQIWETLTGGQATNQGKKQKRQLWWTALGVGALVFIAIRIFL
jgi:hypothetical protein